MKNTILISIKKIYADKIISGEKIFEYRRVIPASKISGIALYCTFPIQKIVAIVNVVANLTNHLDKLWEITRFGGALSKSAFDSYFNGLIIGHAYKLGKVKRLNSPLPLNAINKSLRYPPQSFRYLDDKEFNILLQ
ncbi:MAG: hypothetical protein LBO66_15315 [Deltaproteobacteria bacterium]|jgi:predicted transcriptional regulator|nr:hypothetical protein [Deltaproteobacteria bacterium]